MHNNIILLKYAVFPICQNFCLTNQQLHRIFDIKTSFVISKYVIIM